MGVISVTMWGSALGDISRYKFIIYKLCAVLLECM